MKLDMRPMLRGEVSVIEVDFILSPEEVKGVTFPEGAHIVGNVTDNSGYMQLKLDATLPYEGECARCLSPVKGTFSTSFVRTVAKEGMLSERQIEENVDEYLIIEKGFLDLDEPLQEELLLSFPSKLLCEEDCPGLCPKCGKPLKDSSCSCPKTERDPRWNVLAELLEKEDEKE